MAKKIYRLHVFNTLQTIKPGEEIVFVIGGDCPEVKENVLRTYSSKLGLTVHRGASDSIAIVSRMHS